ncbi:MAG: hypothetical protein IIA87_00750 [Nanoarchaeota archaeon]|nr:hypothetical protein [Nanoarchaeota archaeon]
MVSEWDTTYRKMKKVEVTIKSFRDGDYSIPKKIQDSLPTTKKIIDLAHRELIALLNNPIASEAVSRPNDSVISSTLEELDDITGFRNYVSGEQRKPEELLGRAEQLEYIIPCNYLRKMNNGARRGMGMPRYIVRKALFSLIPPATVLIPILYPYVDIKELKGDKKRAQEAAAYVDERIKTLFG